MKSRFLFKLKQHLAHYRIVEWYRRQRSASGKVFSPEMLEGAEIVTIVWPPAIPKPRIGLVKDCSQMLYTPPYAYWPRYERFLKNNAFPFEFYDISRSDWLTQSERFDVVVWRPGSDPATQYEAESKIGILELKGKKCFPSFSQIWSYEDKIRQYYLLAINHIPVIPTFISHNRDEAISYVRTAPLPIVSKLTNGSGSMGVTLFTSRRSAEAFVRRVFAAGSSTYWSYLRQKDYVYFQEFIEDASFDLRVIVVGERLFGYYRMCPPHDFRASGAGIFVKKEIPPEALSLAWQTAQIFNTPQIAVDMLYSPKRGSFFIIETSIFFQIDTAEQLKVDDIPGYYQRQGDRFVFIPGRFWVQELALKQFLEITYLRSS